MLTFEGFGSTAQKQLPMSLDVTVMKGKPIGIGLSAEVSIWDHDDIGVLLNISDAGYNMKLDAHLLDDMFNVTFDFESVGPLNDPSELSISGSAEQSLCEWLTNEAGGYIDIIKDAIDGQIDKDKTAVDNW